MIEVVEQAQMWDPHRPPDTTGFTLLEHSCTSTGSCTFSLPEDVICHLAARMLNQTNDGARRLTDTLREIENEIARRTALRLKG